jgi:hypothetical protein
MDRQRAVLDEALADGAFGLSSGLDYPPGAYATTEELAALDPELSEALFGTPKLPFSVTLEFPPFDAPDFARALEIARASAEYR